LFASPYKIRTYTPKGNRTPVTELRTRRPRPLDDGGGLQIQLLKLGTFSKQALIDQISALHKRRRRDSNPRYLSAQRFSRPPQSTTLPLLQIITRIT
jgi:hypothetical protein